MELILLWFVKGAGYGLLAAFGLTLTGFGLEFLNCTCSVLTNCSYPDLMFGWGGLPTFILMIVAGGAAIGLCYGIYLRAEQKEEEAKTIARQNAEAAQRQRVRWAGEVQQEALKTHNICTSNQKGAPKLEPVSHTAEKELDNIWKELSELTEVQGQIACIVAELNTKGGDAE